MAASIGFFTDGSLPLLDFSRILESGDRAGHFFIDQDGDFIAENLDIVQLNDLTEFIVASLEQTIEIQIRQDLPDGLPQGAGAGNPGDSAGNRIEYNDLRITVNGDDSFIRIVQHRSKQFSFDFFQKPRLINAPCLLRRLQDSFAAAADQHIRDTAFLGGLSGNYSADHHVRAFLERLEYAGIGLVFILDEIVAKLDL